MTTLLRKRPLRTRDLVAALSKAILESRWAEGDALPSVRELAEQYDVGRETARLALKELAERGLVEMVHGSGTLLRAAASRSEAPVPSTADTSPFSMAFSGNRTCRLSVATCEFEVDKRGLWNRALVEFGAGGPHSAMPATLSLRPASGHPTVAEGDIVHTSTQALATLGREGQLLNLHALIRNAPALRDGLFPGLDRFVSQDPCWAMPVGFDIEIACLNRDRIPAPFLERLPAAWHARGLAEWAADLERETGMIRPIDFPRPSLVMAMCGVDLVTTFDSPAARETTLRALEEVRAAHALYPLYAPGALNRDLRQEAQDRFLAREAVLVFQHTFDLPQLRRKARFDWEVRRFPRPPGSVVRCWPLGVGISRRCEFPEEAFAFIRFLSEPAGQAIMAAGKNNMPAHSAILRLPDWGVPPPAGMDELAGLESVRPWDELGDIALTRPYLAAWDGEVEKMLLEGQAPAETLERLEERCGLLKAAHGDGGDQ